jgi:protein-tyrosine phosphatase
MELTPINSTNTLFVSGDIDDWSLVKAQRIDTIIDMDGDIDVGVPEVPNEILYIYFPIHDDQLPNQTKLHALAMFVARLVRDGHPVLIHCLMGLNRSCLIAATALTYLGLSGEEALAHLQHIRPGALFNPKFADHIRQLPAR